jgi:hypothetical protein
MSRLRKFFILRSILFLVGLAVLVGGLDKPAAAQGQDFGFLNVCYYDAGGCVAWATSAIAASTTNSQIDTYSQSIVDYNFETYCSIDSNYYCEAAAVEQTLVNDNHYEYDDDTDAWEGAAEVCATAPCHDPLIVGNTYELDSYFGFVPCFYDSSGYFHCDAVQWNPNGGRIIMATGAPTITSIYPEDDSVGASGQITLGGTYFVDAFGVTATPQITGSGVSLQVASATQTSMVLNYTIAYNATTGDQQLTLSNRFGTSNAAVFHVGDPTPVITFVSPNPWNAGTITNITISGYYFGTNPSLQITGPGVTGSSIVNSSDTLIHGTVTIDPNSAGGQATVYVYSNGYLGNGFIATDPGQPQDGTYNVNIDPILPNPPAIMMGTDPNGGICSTGTNIAGTQPTVYAGQQISLTGCIPNQGAGVAYDSWSPTSFPTSTAVAGFSVGGAPDYVETLTAVQATNCPANYWCDQTPLYWVAQGNQGTTLTFSYTLLNGLPAQASVSFNVLGPTGYSDANGVTTTTGNYNVGIDNNGVPALVMAGVVISGYKPVGIEFQANGNEPSTHPGLYSWVQLVNGDALQQLDYFGRGACTGGPSSGDPQLDNSFPYIGIISTKGVSNDTATDAPESLLQHTWGERERVFNATMYLIWTPDKDNNCTNGNACTIPVPLGSLNWNLNGDTVNTLITNYGNSGTTFGVNCAYPKKNGDEQVTFTPGTAYPIWHFTYSGVQQCP